MSSRPRLDKSVIAKQILLLCRQRGPDKTICPSDVARALDPVSWRGLMPAVREAAQRLSDEKRIVVLQKGHPIDLRDARGPVRFKIVR